MSRIRNFASASAIESLRLGSALLNYAFPGPIIFGLGAVSELGQAARKLGGCRALLISGPTIARAGLVNQALQSLHDAHVEVVQFLDAQINPTDENVKQGAALFRQEKCDIVIAMGGGSRLDAAKGIRLLATHPGDLEQYYLDNGGATRINANMPPLICVPTTAGSGSETSRGAVITDTHENRKRLIASPALMSSLAILDPALTESLSPYLTAISGIDALSHAIETYVGTGFNPLAKGISRQAAAIIYQFLPRAVADGHDLEARGQILFASAMVALSFGKGLGVVHSLAHPLSPVANLSHGLAVSIILPHGMDFNRSTVTSDYAELARAMGIADNGYDDERPCEELVEAVRELNSDFDLPQSLGDAGVPESAVPSLVERALLDHCHKTNPRSCSREDMRELFERAF